MLQKALMVIGAGPNQLPLIRAAKERGLYVIATDLDAGAEGFALCDGFGVVSTRDVEKSIKYAVEIHERIPLSGVATIASELSLNLKKSVGLWLLSLLTVPVQGGFSW